jgi:hypothetical protein
MDDAISVNLVFCVYLIINIPEWHFLNRFLGLVVKKNMHPEIEEILRAVEMYYDPARREYKESEGSERVGEYIENRKSDK